MIPRTSWKRFGSLGVAVGLATGSIAAAPSDTFASPGADAVVMTAVDIASPHPPALSENNWKRAQERWLPRGAGLEYVPAPGVPYTIGELKAIAGRTTAGVVPEIAAGLDLLDRESPGITGQLDRFGVRFVFGYGPWNADYQRDTKSIGVPLLEETKASYFLRYGGRFPIPYGTLVTLAETAHAVDHMLNHHFTAAARNAGLIQRVEFPHPDHFFTWNDNSFEVISRDYRGPAFAHMAARTNDAVREHALHGHLLGPQGMFQIHELFMEGVLHHMATPQTREALRNEHPDLAAYAAKLLRAGRDPAAFARQEIARIRAIR